VARRAERAGGARESILNEEEDEEATCLKEGHGRLARVSSVRGHLVR
jgi:hypothetical protein